MTDRETMAQRLTKHIGVPEIVKNTYTLAKALLTGENVSPDRLVKRLEICNTCPLVQRAPEGLRCGICGCKVSGDKKLINLARFEETDSYGCKYSGGSKWKAEGV